MEKIVCVPCAAVVPADEVEVIALDGQNVRACFDCCIGLGVLL